ncbi:MAG: hypothetical protein OEM96_06670, partial [Gemmatimonadota bacterium]|nr:hypothetical protein [Gemmatimonadota bacterium]
MSDLAIFGIPRVLSVGIAAGLVGVGTVVVPVRAQSPQLRVEEWTVPWPDSRPRDPYAAPDGRVWFVGQQ